ncbi:ATPase family AAA domain-containing protein 2-like [Hirundo rustica]|uniref:ATPase family AAA domain-containing protein 2-like n=1 Tax=Hirundo rustica TaxID=43150 RepID=UPI001A9416A8|nr:ATPase family AAA domain-containing protein 2-like [Hirundo rustica]
MFFLPYLVIENQRKTLIPVTRRESLNMGRTNNEKPDDPVFSPERNEGKEGDGLRRSFRQRKAVERYESPLENLRKRKRRSSKCTSPVKEKDSCKKLKRSLSANSKKDDIKGVPNDHRKTEATRKGNLSEVHKDHIIIGASLAGVEQMQIDGSAQFHCVGGLSDHISALKEMVILPLLYPDVFEILKFKPPRGCLFYGPPGTGKTLVARALANECSRGDRKVTFFMRSAADCMSKWVGESERQLRLVFEQAYQMRPSIIFFDEIDALAPVRSSKQDQVHSSVVGTLLTLMDGLASRGEVVVIGATNRLDSIDPALRRPGRFEREFRFNLPNKEARLEIFKIHTRDWTLKPSDNLLEDLAEKCIGFCGADIKALCADAGLCALRRRYPQIHESDKRLKIDARSIKVTAKDFAMAMQKIVPASQRAGASSGRALPPISKPLLENTLERILQALQRTFPHAKLALKKNEGNDGIDSDDDSPSISEKRPYSKRAEFHTFSRNLSCQPTSFRPRFLLVGEPGCGPAFDLAPAILHALEKFPAYTLDLTNLFVSTTSQEGTCSQLIQEAQRTAPSIIYIPQIPSWWEAAGPTLKAGFTGLLNSIPYFAPVLLLATSDVPHEDLPEEIKALFNTNHGEVFNIPRPTCAERKAFYENLIMKQAAEPPASKNNIGSQVHLPARCSQVDVQPQVWDKKAIKIQKRGVFVDYSELREPEKDLDF